MTAIEVFTILKQMKGDRTRFLGRATARLGEKGVWIRHAAVEFLGSAGTEAEAVPLTLLLLDERSEVRFATAKAVAAIGGKGQIEAFDLIIKNATNYDRDGKLILSNFDIEKFEQCRDELKARLKKQEEEKFKKAPPPEKK